MKLQMKLRTRLFLGFSALMTVALLGLLLALVSVMQMAKSQEQLIRNNFAIIEINQQLRQTLGNHLIVMLTDSGRSEALEPLSQSFQQTLERGIAEASDEADRQAFQAVASAYASFLQQVDSASNQNLTLLEDNPLSQAFNQVRSLMTDMQRTAYDKIRDTELRSRDRASLLAGLLGLTAIAVLLIGFITAHSFARRFGEPIERLSAAADQIGRGDFNISLPTPHIAELSSLSRRFGLMAQALHEFKQTNVEALVNGQQRLQALLDSIDDGLLIVDRDGRLEHANPVAQRQLAWENEHLGSTLGEALGYPDLDNAARQVLDDKPLSDPPEDLIIEADGERRLLAWRISPVSHHDGSISGAVMVLHDVTDQRTFERVRNEFVLRASHELRTPVTGMQMAFSLLRERLRYPAGSRESDLFDTVHEEMQRLVRLINDLLNFSRYQSGQQKLELEQCHIPELLEAARQRFEVNAAEQEVQLKLELQQPLPTLMLDRQQIERVMDNLLSNALRHTPKGGEVRLLARHHGERMILSVEDNGEGIPYSQQARIFEPFVQIGRRRGGAGLGLALCKEIAQLHGGRIGVHSRIGHGTIFYVALPI
ncbi:KinB sensor domain-containing domain [Stutzerimonas kunmingensis]|uniref:PAS domain-containing protein n=1 Tax=Stutzerimonas chloritidismutans TaxID=203192 RepID=A0ACC5VI20_STUCH|nr:MULTISPECIES: KinB sensor domain-containing domain [Stutzerimonas stutzeri subgroup]MBU0919085.1 PAS domain-containing protein [Gammaproteobacteria bacterium]OCX98663.1 MAG: PAS domain-containing sensor histidine kinase [Pseudomonas sp. K35]OHC14775.1 MAG: PAS domain-containing sensor histidine kinase [Pseudomonadales bacterium GWC2_63_15]CEG53624.1 Alginate biosynthesis sensor protein KinB [Stutzerimonas xanthomarina]MBX7272199.1 PAS domain-containing protein [Stutzerimonas chloritidismuta